MFFFLFFFFFFAIAHKVKLAFCPWQKVIPDALVLADLRLCPFRSGYEGEYWVIDSGGSEPVHYDSEQPRIT